MDGQDETVPVDPRRIPRARRSPEALEPVSPGVVDAERGQVLSRYARLMRSGRPEVCRPARREREVPRPRSAPSGSDGKVIYPDRDAAESAARELEALGGRPQRPYLCARSRRGHFHLTTDLPAQRTRSVEPGYGVLRSAIPQPRGHSEP